MRILVVGGIYKSQRKTIDGGYTIAKILGTYSNAKIDYVTQFSSNEQALTRRIKQRLDTLGVNYMDASSVSMDYGEMDAYVMNPGSNAYSLNRLRKNIRGYSCVIVSTDIDEMSVKQILAKAQNSGIPSIVFTRGEFEVSETQSREVIELTERSYELAEQDIRDVLEASGYIGETVVEPLSQTEIIINKIKSIYVVPRLFITGVLVLILFLSTMALLNYFSERGEYPTHVNWNQSIDHPNCDTVETCAQYGDDLIDEIEDHINLLADPYVFHENRTNTNFITYDIVDGQPVDAVHHNDLPFGDEERFLSIWEMYDAIVPAAYDGAVDRFRLFSDGEGSRVAYVAISPTDTLLAVDIRDVNNRSQLYRTLIHEFAHVYSLPISDFTCASTDMSCIKDDAMLSEYMERFWTHYDENWYDNTNKPMPQREAFYNTNFSDFYIPYQATNVKEDFAVTFVQFIIRPAPVNPVQLKDIKVHSLYEREELVLMRLEMLENILALEESES